MIKKKRKLKDSSRSVVIPNFDQKDVNLYIEDRIRYEMYYPCRLEFWQFRLELNHDSLFCIPTSIRLLTLEDIEKNTERYRIGFRNDTLLMVGERQVNFYLRSNYEEKSMNNIVNAGQNLKCLIGTWKLEIAYDEEFYYISKEKLNTKFKNVPKQFVINNSKLDQYIIQNDTLFDKTTNDPMFTYQLTPRRKSPYWELYLTEIHPDKNFRSQFFIYQLVKSTKNSIIKL